METLDIAEYDVVALDWAVSAIERRLLSPSGREELEREIVALTQIEARLFDVLYVLRPRTEKAA